MFNDTEMHQCHRGLIIAHSPNYCRKQPNRLVESFSDLISLSISKENIKEGSVSSIKVPFIFTLISWCLNDQETRTFFFPPIFQNHIQENQAVLEQNLRRQFYLDAFLLKVLLSSLVLPFFHLINLYLSMTLYFKYLPSVSTLVLEEDTIPLE